MKVTLVFVVMILLYSLCGCKKEYSASAALNGPTVGSNFAMVQTNTSLPYYAEIVLDKTTGKWSDTCAISRNGKGIIFIGNSYVNNWQYYHWDATFKNYPILNRGFGGSRWRSIQNYKYDIFACYRPKQVILYEGTNEVSTGEPVARTISDFKNTFNQLRAIYPSARISVISQMYCPAHKPRWDSITAINRGVKAYLLTQPNVDWIYVSDKIGQTGWRVDGIHPAQIVYDNLAVLIKPYFLK